MEKALLEITPLTTAVTEDDHPAVASRNGVTWVVWMSYSSEDHLTSIMARSWEKTKWSAPVTLTEARGDHYKPAVAIDGDGAVVAVWAAQVNGNWDLYARRMASGKWGAVERLTTDAGPDLLPALAAAGNRVLLVWQGVRKQSHDILFRMLTAGKWGPEGAVTASTAHDWEPQAAATSDGAFHVAWDSYRGDYDVMIRTWRGGAWGPETPVAASPKLENHVSLSADARNRVWIAFEIGPENWASDSAEGGLRPRRDIGLACLVNGRLHRAAEAEAALNALGGERGIQAPATIAGKDGVLRLFFRKQVTPNFLAVNATVWDGAGWSKPEALWYSEGRIDQRVVTADAGDRVIAVYPAGSQHNVVYTRAFETAGVASEDRVPALTPQTVSAKSAPAERTPHTFSGYRLVFGDLHRHTDISEDGGIPDGSLIDAMRYALDAAPLEFLGVTDHTRYLPRRYNLFRIQQVADAFYKPGLFTPVHAYERSQYSPWGHRNVVSLRRNYTPVPAAYEIGDPGVSPWGLFDALRGKNAMSIPHTSAWQNKQVSWDYYDPEIERLVEMYQGLRSTYEYNGAPDPADRAIYEKDSKNFVWDALARKRKLGFIASSDHRSTHMSFAAVYVKTLDRDGVFEGLNARRTYAATDRILLDVSMGGTLMGQETVVAGVPELAVAVEGTANVARIDVIKNGQFVYTAQPNARTAKFTFRDQQFDGQESYYYVRVIQTDKMMAWASPIWVRR
jgi:hypothetical protein